MFAGHASCCTLRLIAKSTCMVAYVLLTRSRGSMNGQCEQVDPSYTEPSKIPTEALMV